MADQRKVILPSRDEQLAEEGDSTYIDPNGVKVIEPITVFMNHEYRIPENYLGRVSNVRVEDGELVADFSPARQIPEDAVFRVAGRVDESHVEGDLTVVDKMTLLEVSWVARAAKELKEETMPNEIPDSGFTDVEKARERGRKLQEGSEPEFTAEQALGVVLSTSPGQGATMDENQQWAPKAVEHLERLGFEIRPR